MNTKFQDTKHLQFVSRVGLRNCMPQPNLFLGTYLLATIAQVITKQALVSFPPATGTAFPLHGCQEKFQRLHNGVLLRVFFLFFYFGRYLFGDFPGLVAAGATARPLCDHTAYTPRPTPVQNTVYTTHPIPRSYKIPTPIPYHK